MIKRTRIKAVLVLLLAVSVSGCVPALINPSDMVSLGAFANPGQTQDVNSGNPDGTGGGLFVIPGDKVLVITRVIVHPLPISSGTLEIALMQSDSALGDRIRQTWQVPGSQPTEFDFTPGYVVSSAGSKLMIRNSSNSTGSVHVAIYGYVAPTN